MPYSINHILIKVHICKLNVALWAEYEHLGIYICYMAICVNLTITPTRPNICEHFFKFMSVFIKCF